jgi:hypothetical protein
MVINFKKYIIIKETQKKKNMSETFRITCGQKLLDGLSSNAAKASVD